MTIRMRAGTLTRLVTFQALGASPDSYGGQPSAAGTWTDVKSVYAAIEPLSGRELLAAQQLSIDVTHRITVRYDAALADPRIVAAMRVVYGARYFNVRAAMNIDEGNRVIELAATEGLKDG
jgi:SPP1 family predicted phage head-tail adaptor